MAIREIMAAKLKAARTAAGMTAAEVGDKVGKSAKTVYSWETGKGQPDADVLIKLCRIYKMDVGDFFTEAENQDAGNYIDVPVYGSIAAGTPIEMIEQDRLFPIPSELHDRYPNAFLLEVQGESMNRKIPNGSFALVNPTKDIVDGKAYAVCVNGFDATIKRVRKLAHGLELAPDSIDPTYRPKVYDYNEPETEEITVIGRVVWYIVPFDFDI